MPRRSSKSIAASERNASRAAAPTAAAAAPTAAAAADDDDTCPGQMGVEDGAECKQAVLCLGCGRCDRHCRGMLLNKRHCNSDEEDSSEDDEEGDGAAAAGAARTRGGAAAAAAAAPEDEEEATDHKDRGWLTKVVDFFGISESFKSYTYNQRSASTPAKTARSNAFNLLTRCAAKLGEILVQRSAPEDIVAQWHRQEVGIDAEMLQNKGLEMLKALPSRSEGHRTLGAVLCAASPRKKGSAIPNVGLTSVKSVKAGRDFFDKIVQAGKVPELPPITRARGSDEKIKRLVCCQISSENVQSVSWSEKLVTCDGFVTNVPAMSRLKSVSTMYYDYKRDVPKEYQVSWKPFSQVAKAITGKQIIGF